MKKQDFFEKYQINENVLSDTGLVRSELIGIKSEFEKARDKLSIDANYVADRIRSFDRMILSNG